MAKKNSKFEIKEAELMAILDETSEQLAKAFRASEERLVKATPPAPEEESDDSAPAEGSESAPAEGSESAPAEASAPPAEASASAPAPDMGSAGGAPDMSASAPADPAAAGMGGGQPTPEMLENEYKQLPDAELDMHIAAALQAKQERQAMGGAGMPPDASAGGPAAPVAPPGADASASVPGPTMKSEIAASPERNGKDSIDAIRKSFEDFNNLNKKRDEELQELRALVKSQSEDIENLAKFAKAMSEQPMRKAVTSMTGLAKSEQVKPALTRESIHNHLKALTAKPDLKKSDRQLITDFYDGRVNVDKLAHLFEGFQS